MKGVAMLKTLCFLFVFIPSIALGMDQRQAYQILQKFNHREVANSDLFRIKEIAAEDYPRDYITQLYVVRKQVEAYVNIRHYVDRRLTPDVFTRVKAAIAKNHPDDYRTQYYVLRHRIDWYVKQDKRKQEMVHPFAKDIL